MGLTGAVGGVPNGFCEPGTPCPNVASDYTTVPGTTCTQTAHGPQCLSKTFPLGTEGLDAGAG
jgi:hypothetical protein